MFSTMEVYRKLRAEVCALQDYVSLRMPEALKGQHFSDPLMYLPAPPPPHLPPGING